MDVLAILQEKLKEEQWTRASIVDQSGLQELSELVQQIIDSKKQEKASEVCLEVLKISPKSVIALFVVGFSAYTMENKENTVFLQQLVETLRDNKKNSLAEFICNKILKEEPSNIYALQVLLQIYTEAKNETEQLKVLLQLLRLDLKNGQIPQKIAEYYEQHPDKSKKETEDTNPLKYYQLALRRFAKSQNIIKVEEIWKKLSSNLSNVNYFLNIAMMVAEYNSDLAGNLLFSLVDTLKNNQQYDAALSILKKLLLMDYDAQKLRDQYISLYESKYTTSSQLKISLENSGILNSKEKLDNNIKKFEKEIQFVEKGFVSHQVWGVGKIKAIAEDHFLIDFDSHPNHKMSYNMALNSLTPLHDQHIWVIKNSKIEINPDTQMEEILLMVLNSFPNKNLSIDDLKNELVPSIIPATKWTSWWNKAKNILKENPSIGTVKEGRPKYFIRTISIPLDEEMIEKFQLSRRFDEKLKLLEQFIKEVSILDDYSDQLKDMVSYFEMVVQNPNRFDFQDYVLAILLIQKLIKTIPWAVEEHKLPVQEMLLNSKGLESFLTSTCKIEYKKELTQLILQYHPHAQQILRDVLYSDNTQVADFIMEQLKNILDQEELNQILNQGINELFRENPVMTFWFLNYVLQNNLEKNISTTKEDLFKDVLYRLNTVGKLQEQKNLKWFKNSPNSTEVKKIITLANDTLFRFNDFTNFITTHSSKKYVLSIYELIKLSSVLNSKNKTELIKALSEKIPQNTLLDNDITTSSIDYLSNETIWTSNEGLDKQKKRLLELENERQANLIELETAREKGDLRENAEYQAAREKDSLLTNSISELGEQLKKATVIDSSDISGDEVIPGTVITLKRNKKKEVFTILGFWDTDEENGVIAYNSPLASAILHMKKGEQTTVELGVDQVTIEIIDIKVYNK